MAYSRNCLQRSLSSSHDSSKGHGSLLKVAVTFLFCVVLVLGFAAGCARAVLLPDSSPIRIGPKAKAKVYYWTGTEWNLSSNEVEIPEGWYCVPPRFVEESESKEVPSS